jgi:hypothetical protein
MSITQRKSFQTVSGRENNLICKVNLIDLIKYQCMSNYMLNCSEKNCLFKLNKKLKFDHN